MSEVSYVAARTIRVQTESQGVVIVLEGDPVPEASGWAHKHRLVKGGFIRAVPLVVPPVKASPLTFDCSLCGKKLRTGVGLKKHHTSVHKNRKA